MKSATENLLNEIEKFLRKTGMVASVFGRRAVGDPNLVNQVRGGRELRHDTLLRVRRFMSAVRKSDAA